MKAKSKFSYKKGYSLLIALTMIVYLNPYFVWETYYGGVFSVLRELMIYTSFCHYYTISTNKEYKN